MELEMLIMMRIMTHLTLQISPEIHFQNLELQVTQSPSKQQTMSGDKMKCQPNINITNDDIVNAPDL